MSLVGYSPWGHKELATTDQLCGQPLWRTVCRFLKKLNKELPYDPAIPLLDIYLEKNMIRKDTCTIVHGPLGREQTVKFFVFCVSQTEKEKYCRHLLYVESKNK